jgi:hypothetical protein
MKDDLTVENIIAGSTNLITEINTKIILLLMAV